MGIQFEKGESGDNSKHTLIDSDYRHIVHEGRQLICVTSQKGKIQRLNQAWNALLGYDCAELEGIRLLDLFHPADIPRVESIFSSSIEPENPQNVSGRIRNSNTEYIGIEWFVVRKNGYIYFSGREVPASRNKSNIEHRENLLDKSGELAHFGIWEYRCETQHLYWSMQTKKIHEVENNYTPSVERALQFYTDKKSRSIIEKAFRDVLEDGKSYDHQLKITTARGNKRWVRTWGKPILKHGKCVYIVGTIQDITKEKYNEIELKKQKNRLSNIIDAAKLGTWEYNVITGENRWNERWAEIIGYNLEELKGNSIDMFFELIHPNDEKRLKRKLKRYLEGQLNSYQAEFRMRHKQGHWVWVHDSGEIISRTEEGQPEIMYGIHLDITEQKKTQKKLKQSEKSFRSNFENAGIGMAIVDKSGIWIKTNQQLQDMLGYSHAELNDLSFFDITHPDDIKLTRKQNKKLLIGEADKINFKKRYIHKNSNTVHVDLYASAIRKEGEIDYIIAQIIDITKEVKLKKQLQNTVANLKAIMDASSEVAIIGTDVNGTITTFNKGAEKMLGYSAEEVVGKYTPEHFHTREQIQERAADLKKRLDRKVSGFEVFISDTKIDKPDTKEWIKVAKDGTKIPVLLTISAIIKNGELTGYLGINTNLSKIKESEEKLQKILSITIDQNKKLKHFAHIVSHNIRGHSANIQKLVDLIMAELPEMKENKMLQMIRQASVQLRKVIDDLSYVTNIIADKETVTKAHDLSVILDETLKSLKLDIDKHDVTIINEVRNKKIAEVNKEYACGVIRSIIDNSIAYRSKKRSSYVKIYLKEKNNYYILHIVDNGIGFDAKNQENKLYNMYAKMHEEDDGAGLDLFISRYQMEAMGGYIKIDSEIDVGTTVKLYFTKT